MSKDYITIVPCGGLRGQMSAPGDKSVSQRAVMLAALAVGDTVIRHCLRCDDTAALIQAFGALGVAIEAWPQAAPDSVHVRGRGAEGLAAPPTDLYMGNSGTSSRLLTGVLAGQCFSSVISGDMSLSGRPMRRILEPLRLMGARISATQRDEQDYLPLLITGQSLQAIDYVLPVRSAQVKSCVLLAGLCAAGRTRVTEQLKTRDHTERMATLFGASLYSEGLTVSVDGGVRLRSPGELIVPGDISSAAFFLVAATIVAKSRVVIRRMGVNPTRAHVLAVLARMGARVQITPAPDPGPEPVADILVESAALRATELSAEETAYCIDELPILCVAAAVAQGTTRLRECAELRFKETDRVNSLATNLRTLGVDIRVEGTDIVINGPAQIQGGTVESYGDHRTAMCMAVAGLVAAGPVTVGGWSCVSKSYPAFSATLAELCSG